MSAGKLLLIVALLVIAAGCTGEPREASEKKPQTQQKAVQERPEGRAKPEGPQPTITPSTRVATPTPIAWATAFAPPQGRPPAPQDPVSTPVAQPTMGAVVTVPPTSAPAPLRLDIRSVTSSLRPNMRAKLTARTAPGAEGTLTINFPSGQREELETKFAADDGALEWEFDVGPQPQPGTWRLVVTSALDDNTVTREVRVQVFGVAPTSTPRAAATGTATATRTPAAPTMTVIATRTSTPATAAATATRTSTPSRSPTATATPRPSPPPGVTATPTATPRP